MDMIAGYAGGLAFAWLTLFQVMLAAGLPLGRLAWGGTHRVLPSGLRIASLMSAVVSGAAVLVVAQAAGFGPVPLPEAWITPALFALAALFTLSLLANLFGARGLERLHGVPLAGLCAGSSLLLALG